MFSFFDHHVSFIFVQNFRHIWIGTTNVFYHNSLWNAFWNEFFNHFHGSSWEFFCWNHISFQSATPNNLLRSARIVFKVSTDLHIKAAAAVTAAICFKNANYMILPSFFSWYFSLYGSIENYIHSFEWFNLFCLRNILWHQNVQLLKETCPES